MSRRSGQCGHIEVSGNWYVVRWWMDVEGQEKRRYMREKICSISGPGKLSASERERKAKEIIAASGADSVEHFKKVVYSNHGITFRAQAAMWLAQVRNRKRKPVAPSTLGNWESCLKNWLNPNIGDMPLGSISNLALKNLGETMVKGGLGASAIRSYTNVVKMVVASAVNEQGEELYPRKWNHEFMDLPEDKNPKRPWFTGDVVTKIVAKADTQMYRVLFALCAAAGLRFGEALGIDIKSISPDCSTIKICQKAWRGQLHDFLKSDNGEREIDLHPKMAAMLKEFIGERRHGLLFRSRTGKQLWQTNILRRSLHPILAELDEPKCGVHAFRRFRLTHIREYGVPKDLEHFWMGHQDGNGAASLALPDRGKEIGDIYSKLKERVAFRKKWAEQIGLGFEIPPMRKGVKSVQVWQENCSFEPMKPKIEIEALEKMAVSA